MSDRRGYVTDEMVGTCRKWREQVDYRRVKGRGV